MLQGTADSADLAGGLRPPAGPGGFRRPGNTVLMTCGWCDRVQLEEHLLRIGVRGQRRCMWHLAALIVICFG
jgi:hypothetical protein